MSLFTPFVNGGLLPEKRSGHVSFYYQGQFFVFGGYGDWNERENEFLPSKHVWCYNIEASQWTRYTTKGEYPGNATGSCATVVGDKMFLFAGYYQQQGQTNQIFSFDLTTYTWINISEQTRGRKPSPRDKFGSWTYRQKILYFGGFGSPPDNMNKTKGDFCFEELPRGMSHGFGWNNHLHIFDCCEIMKWSQPISSGDIPCPRAAFAVCQIDSTGYLFGGRYKDERRNDLYSLDLKTYKWKEIKSTNTKLPVGRSWHVLARVSTCHLFLYGGFDTIGDTLKDTWIFSIKTNQWFELENATRHLGYISSRLWHTACHTESPGEILIFGGCATSVLGNENTVHTNTIVIFRFSPLSLRSLCLDYVMLNVGKYYAHFDDLPRSLKRNISYRCHALGLNCNNGHGKLINNCIIM